MKLSVIVPSIRGSNLPNLYKSIKQSFSADFEMIVICPFLEELERLDENVSYIQSLRSPNSCQQIGLSKAVGDYVTFAADDGIFIPGILDHAFINLLFSDNSDFIDYKTIVVGKYLEGDSPNPDMKKEDYYKFKYHKAYRLKGVPQESLIFNCGIISRKFIMELGGWDAENFDCTTMAHADLGIRALKAGANMILMDEVMFQCSHEPGKTGTHAPVHNAMKRDIVNFRKLYSTPNKRINIDLDNWKITPELWKERFK